MVLCSKIQNAPHTHPLIVPGPIVHEFMWLNTERTPYAPLETTTVPWAMLYSSLCGKRHNNAPLSAPLQSDSLWSMPSSSYMVKYKAHPIRTPAS